MLVGDLELEQKGIQVLLRHYLNLGGRFLAFNRDPVFRSKIIHGTPEWFRFYLLRP